MNDKILTVQQAAELLHPSAQTVRAACRRGELPAVHIGRRWLIARDKLMVLVEGGEQCPSA